VIKCSRQVPLLAKIIANKIKIVGVLALEFSEDVPLSKDRK